MNYFVHTYLIDWNTLRALYTHHSSNDYGIVKEIRIGQSAAKQPIRLKVQRLSSRRGVLKKKISLSLGKGRLVFISLCIEHSIHNYDLQNICAKNPR